MSEKWKHHLDYVITVLGFSIGAGAFVRFPFFCTRNGGGAFVIVCTLFTILGALPSVFVEMVVGQLGQSGPVKAWNICPLFKGIGVGACIVSALWTSYYTVTLSWYIYYLYWSCSASLPWMHCQNDWNSPSCFIGSVFNASTNATLEPDYSLGNTTRLSAAEEFWRYHVLGMTKGLEEVGKLRLHLVICVGLIDIFIFVCLFKGIKVSGKVAYVTVLVPYILITILIVRGCLLPGSGDGLYFYLYPNFEKLLDPKVWMQGCSYAILNLGVGMGTYVTMSGHNKIRTNCFKDAVLMCVLDMSTAAYAGIAFFGAMGHLKYLSGRSFESFESSGVSLGLIVYPQILAVLPLPQVWSFITFLMLFMLGVDCLIPCYEVILTALEDEFPRLQRKRNVISCLMLLMSFAVGLIYVTEGGIFILSLVDWFVHFPSLVLFAVIECLVVSWCYGTDKLQVDIKLMWGGSNRRVMTFMVFLMKYVCPLLLTMVFCYSCYSYQPPKYEDYVYPDWAAAVGWILSLSCVVPVPVIFIWTVVKVPGDTFREKIREGLKPLKFWGLNPALYDLDMCPDEPLTLGDCADSPPPSCA